MAGPRDDHLIMGRLADCRSKQRPSLSPLTAAPKGSRRQPLLLGFARTTAVPVVVIDYLILPLTGISRDSGDHLLMWVLANHLSFMGDMSFRFFVAFELVLF